jgi:uncharacterized protein (TIGR02594 family)
MRVARGELGVRELEGEQRDSDRVREYLATCRGERRLLQKDSTAWCSAFVNWCFAQLQMPRTHSLAARSWLDYGRGRNDYRFGSVIVLWRGAPLPASIKNAPGHVGFVERWDGENVYVLGGNQSNRVSIKPYPHSRVLSVRWPDWVPGTEVTRG